MSDITPRLGIGVPSEFQEPYFQTEQGFQLAVDASIFANAENSQLIFESTGIVGWNATMASPTTGVLFWAADIFITASTTPFKAKLAGPASVQLQDGEVLFFVMPRLMSQETPIQLFKSNRIFLQGTQIVDLRLFCERVGTTLYFYDNKSLKNGDIGYLWGGGLNNISVIPPHEHLAPLIIQPPAPGVFLLDALLITPSLIMLQLYRNGMLQVEPDDYSLNPVTGIITLVTPTLIPNERFVILREKLDTTVVTTSHSHLTALRYAPIVGTTTLDALVTVPTLQGLELYRNGLLQVEPDDYTLNPATGISTLVIPSVLGEIFQLLRRINV